MRQNSFSIHVIMTFILCLALLFEGRTAVYATEPEGEPDSDPATTVLEESSEPIEAETGSDELTDEVAELTEEEITEETVSDPAVPQTPAEESEETINENAEELEINEPDPALTESEPAADDGSDEWEYESDESSLIFEEAETADSLLAADGKREENDFGSFVLPSTEESWWVPSVYSDGNVKIPSDLQLLIFYSAGGCARSKRTMTAVSDCKWAKSDDITVTMIEASKCSREETEAFINEYGGGRRQYLEYGYDGSNLLWEMYRNTHYQSKTNPKGIIWTFGVILKDRVIVDIFDCAEIAEIENELKKFTDINSYADMEFIEENGSSYWYENGTRQGVKGDPKNISDKRYKIERGREVYDPATKAWYWLDAVYDGAKAVNKEVYMPYIFQDEATMSPEKLEGFRKLANTYTEDPFGETAEMGDQVKMAVMSRTGKWVRYDSEGHMYKGWLLIDDDLGQYYPDQVGNIYYYDYLTGLMAKGWTKIGGQYVHFDEITGVLDD